MQPQLKGRTLDMRDMTNGTEISTSFETDEIAEKSESHDVSFNDNRQEIRHPRRPAKVSQHCRGEGRALSPSAVRSPLPMQMRTGRARGLQLLSSADDETNRTSRSSPSSFHDHFETKQRRRRKRRSQASLFNVTQSSQFSTYKIQQAK